VLLFDAQGVFQVAGNADVRISGHEMRAHPVCDSCGSEMCVSPLQLRAGPALLLLESPMGPAAGARARARIGEVALGRKRSSTGPTGTSLRALRLSEKGTSPALYEIRRKPPEQAFCLQVSVGGN